MELNNRLFRVYRKTLNITLDDMYLKTGISIGQLSRWERGIIEIKNSETLEKLSWDFKKMHKKVTEG